MATKRSIYVVGGDDNSTQTNTVERFDPESLTWTTLPSMSTRRSYLAVVALKSSIIALGGFYRVTFKTVESLEIGADGCTSADTWTVLPRMRFESRDIAACVVSDSEVFVLSDMDSETRRNHLSVLNLDSNEWREFSPPMSVLRFGAAVCMLNGYVYAFGGYNGSKHVASVERIPFVRACDNPLIKSLSAISSAQQPQHHHHHHHSTSSDQISSIKAYCINESDDGDDESKFLMQSNNDSDQFNPCESQDSLVPSSSSTESIVLWESIVPMSSARVGFAAVAVEADNTIIVAGGFDGQSVLNSVEILDTNTLEWRCVAPMNRPRSYFAFALLDRKLYVFGGYDGQTKTHEIECYDIDTNSWQVIGTMQCNRFAAAAAAVL